MKDPCDDIRDWLYTSLNGKITYNGLVVPVYSFPAADSTFPYIVIGEHSGEVEGGTKDSYMWDVTTILEIYTSHAATFASYLPVNSISNSILQLLRVRNYGGGYGREEADVAMNNFKVVRVQIGGFATDRELREMEIIISKTMSINILVEEL